MFRSNAPNPSWSPSVPSNRTPSRLSSVTHVSCTPLPYVHRNSVTVAVAARAASGVTDVGIDRALRRARVAAVRAIPRLVHAVFAQQRQALRPQYAARRVGVNPASSMPGRLRSSHFPAERVGYRHAYPVDSIRSAKWRVPDAFPGARTRRRRARAISRASGYVAAQIIGGVVLLGIGLRILVSHLT